MKKANSKEQFFTRTKANKGVKIPLVSSTGEETKEWIQVLSHHSDAYRKISTEERRNAIQAGMENKPYKLDEVRVNASLISAWSFDDECKPEDVYEFLLEAPQIADEVSIKAMDAASFFAPTPTSSLKGSKKKRT